MLVGVVLRRMWRERRVMAVLLLALCLVTAFLALGPLYVRAVASSEFNVRVEREPENTFRVDLTNPQPFDEDRTNSVITEQLGDRLTGISQYQKSAAITCGFLYGDGSQPNINSPFTGLSHCYRPSAYRDYESLFTVVEGRSPQPNPDGPIEVVITREAAEKAVDLDPDFIFTPGTRFFVGATPTTAVAVEIVGIVEPNLPKDHPFWDGQGDVFGFINAVTDNTERIEFSVIMTESDFNTRIQRALDFGSRYTWRINLDRESVVSDQLDAIDASFTQIERTLRDIHPEVNLLSRLTTVISDFRANIAAAEGPITLLSLVVLALMLYNLVTTVALILEQQGEEWAAIASRGGSAFQLVQIQLLTVTILGLLAIGFGPLLARLIMSVLEVVGPQAGILNPQDVGGAIPTNAYLLSAFAGAAAVIVLTIPAWPAARSSILRLKHGISRPPTRPVWARFFLDFILLFIGVAFLARLYSFVSGNLSASLGDLLQNPALLARQIAISNTGGLNDPFNLLGPILLLTGAALLWLRVFPLLMRLIGGLFSRTNGLTVRLALWNVEREPGHYAQLVLLLIGTLALGTASLTLTTTRDIGAWQTARAEVGADAALVLDARTLNRSTDWSTLPNVSAGMPVLVAESVRIPPNPPITLFGVELDAINQSFPEYADVLAPLATAPAPQIAGQPLPEDTASLSLDVYIEPPADDPTPIQTNIALELLDAAQVHVTLPLTTADNSITGQFITYTGNLGTAQGRGTWRLIGIRIMPSRGENLDRFEYLIYLDNLVATTSTGEQIIANDFEPDSYEGWKWARTAGQLAELATVANVSERKTEGTTSLRLRPRISRFANGLLNPTLEFYPVEAQTISVIVSQPFAEQFGTRSSLRRPLRPGDEITSSINFPFGIATSTTQVELRYRVEGIIEAFPSVGRDELFLIARTGDLQTQLNAATTLNSFYDWNRVWLTLENRELTDATRDSLSTIAGYSSSDFAWDRYREIQREPLANALTGMLFASFWVSLGLSLLDFAFYMAVTTRRRAVSFAVLRSIGWDAGKIWGLLTVEQAAFITPALIIGVLLGGALAYLILPFLGLIGSQALQLPLLGIMGLLAALIISFSILLSITALVLRRASLNEILRIE